MEYHHVHSFFPLSMAICAYCIHGYPLKNQALTPATPATRPSSQKRALAFSDSSRESANPRHRSSGNCPKDALRPGPGSWVQAPPCDLICPHNLGPETSQRRIRSSFKSLLLGFFKPQNMLKQSGSPPKTSQKATSFPSHYQAWTSSGKHLRSWIDFKSIVT